MAAMQIVRRLPCLNRMAAVTPLASLPCALQQTPQRNLVVKVAKGKNPGRALEALQARMAREGVEKLLAERKVSLNLELFIDDIVDGMDLLERQFHVQRYMKPKYVRQKNAKDAIYGAAARRRDSLLAVMTGDPHTAPF
jgi:hypothetical protein